jgi:hypothetical protein
VKERERENEEREGRMMRGHERENAKGADQRMAPTTTSAATIMAMIKKRRRQKLGSGLSREQTRMRMSEGEEGTVKKNRKTCFLIASTVFLVKKPHGI